MQTVVIGAGISGLTLAFHLRMRGEEVTVLEAAPRAGGVIQSIRRDGFLLETGPNAFLDHEPAMRRLLERLELWRGVRRAEPASRRRFVYTRGALREAPASPPALIKSDVLPLGAKLRGALELLVPRGGDEDESVAAFARRRFGASVAELIDAVQSGIYAGDPERLSVASAFPRLFALEHEHRSVLWGLSRAGRPGAAALCTFEGGVETLPLTLARALGPSLRLGARVTALRRDGGWRVSVTQASGTEELQAGRVVLALPASGAAELVAPLDAELGRDLAAIVYAGVAVVQLGYRRDASPKPIEGFGFLAPHSEGRKVMGVIYASSSFPWRAPADQQLFTCMMGGARGAALVAMDDSALVELARGELREVLGLDGPPTLSAVFRWPRAIPQYEVGHAARMERVDQRVRALPGLTLIGNAYRGVGLNDCVRNAEATAEHLLKESLGSAEPAPTVH